MSVSQTQKTTQVMIVTSETKPIPASQKVEKIAFFDTAGLPLQGLSSSKARVPTVAPALAAVTNAVAVDASQGNVFDLLLTSSSWTVSAPTNASDGQEIVFRLKQDGTGSRTLAWNAIFDFGSSPGAVTLTTTAGKSDELKFRYNAGLTKWVCVEVAKGD